MLERLGMVNAQGATIFGVQSQPSAVTPPQQRLFFGRDNRSTILKLCARVEKKIQWRWLEEALDDAMVARGAK